MSADLNPTNEDQEKTDSSADTSGQTETENGSGEADCESQNEK